jgi:hypothetical protein
MVTKKSPIKIDQEEGEAKILRKTYPSLSLAYDIAIASYESSVKRLDVIDGRLQTLLTFLVTATFIVPTLANTRGFSFCSVWFFEAMFYVVLAMLVGTYARLCGEVQLLNPDSIRINYLHLSEERFKLDIICYASGDYTANTQLIKKKWILTIVVASLFSLAAVFLGLWVLDTRVLLHRSDLQVYMVPAGLGFSALVVVVLSLEAFVDRYRPSKLLTRLLNKLKSNKKS